MRIFTALPLPHQAVAKLAEGVIVGSALVKQAGESIEGVQELATELRQALNGSEARAVP